MVQVRKLVLAIAAASALSSGMAQALELGELTLKSKQNQPLLAEIELLDVKDLTAAQVVPSLAPEQEFSKAGVPRPAFLDDLRFTPIINADGKSVLRVTSSQPLSEPFVNFLVQVMWPNGRLMRDYSVLLDPAQFSPQAAAASATSAPAAAPVQYTTTSRDTLWEIAAKARNGGSVQQTMLAIQALNPDAFINGNINRLKTGQVLRLPDASQSVQLPQAKAINEVASQNADWRNGRRTVPLAQQLDATGRKTVPAPAAKAVHQDALSLVSAPAGKGAAGDAKKLADQLALTQEGLDSSRRESAELQDRMKDLQSQLDKLQRLIELKNDQLARLEAGKGAPADPAAALPGAQAADAPEADIAPAIEGAPATAVAPNPVETGAVQDHERSIPDLLKSPLLLAVIGGGAVLLLLLLLLLVRRRKALQEAQKHARMARDLESESGFAADLDLPQSSFEGLETPARSVDLAPAPAPAPAPATATAPAPAPAVEAVAAVVAPVSLVKPAADVLDQAERLIEQRQLSEAEALLKVAIDQEPQRSDLRLELMRVYGEMGDRDAFIAQERQLVANGKNHAQVEQLKGRYPGMAVAAAAGIATAAVASQLQAQFVQEMMRDDREVKPQPEPVAPAIEEFDHDFDLSLDELEAASPAVVTPEPVSLDKPVADSFEAVLEQQAQAQAAEQGVADIDLGLPADFDLSLADESAAPVAAPDSFSVELDKVNAELHRLSQSLEQSSLEQPFADDEPEFDFLSGADETATKLDLAQAYIDMGDDEGARDILTEVMEEGNPQQQAEALEMMARLT